MEGQLEFEEQVEETHKLDEKKKDVRKEKREK